MGVPGSYLYLQGVVELAQRQPEDLGTGKEIVGGKGVDKSMSVFIQHTRQKGKWGPRGNQQHKQVDWRLAGHKK